MSDATNGAGSPTVVLVHGAFADASSWNGVIERLQDKAVQVTAPANPLRGISVDSTLRWLSSWEHWRVEREDFIARGNQVVVLCRYTGRGKGSGVDVDTHDAHLWTFREGKAIRLEIFSSRGRALEAVGLEGE